MLVPVLLAVLLSKTSVGEIFDSFTGELASDELIAHYESLNNLENCTNDIKLPCDENEPRRLDGSCYNHKYPTIGAYHTPMRRLLPPAFTDEEDQLHTPTGELLPSVREVRKRMLAEGDGSNSEYTQLITFLPAINFADVGSVHDTLNFLMETTHCCTEKGESDHMCIPIKIPADDSTHRFSNIRCLNLTRPRTFQNMGCAAANTEQARIEFNTPSHDMSFIYNNKMPAYNNRLGRGGLLAYEEENNSIWPSSQGPHNVTSCYANMPELGENRCWGNVQGSILPVTMSNAWFFRLHNKIATELAQINPHWGDDDLFDKARDINIAISNQMTYCHLLPELIGKDLALKKGLISEDPGFRETYDENVKLQTLFEYVLGTRWFHTAAKGEIKLFDENNKLTKVENAVNITLRVGFLPLDDNFAGIVRGTFLQNAGGNDDDIVDPSIAEFGLGEMQEATDLTASDLRKCRAHGTQNYVKYLKYFGFEEPKNWDDLAKHVRKEAISKMKELYDDVSLVEFIVGLWGEKKMEGAYLGKTLALITAEQMKTAMSGDKYWHERADRPGAFTRSQLKEIRKANYAAFLCEVEPKIKTIQRNPLKVVSPLNPLVNCEEIEKWDLSAWKEDPVECD